MQAKSFNKTLGSAPGSRDFVAGGEGSLELWLPLVAAVQGPDKRSASSLQDEKEAEREGKESEK